MLCVQNADISDMLMDRAVLNDANLKYAPPPPPPRNQIPHLATHPTMISSLHCIFCVQGPWCVVDTAKRVNLHRQGQ